MSETYLDIKEIINPSSRFFGQLKFRSLSSEDIGVIISSKGIHPQAGTLVLTGGTLPYPYQKSYPERLKESLESKNPSSRDFGKENLKKDILNLNIQGRSLGLAIN